MLDLQADACKQIRAQVIKINLKTKPRSMFQKSCISVPLLILKDFTPDLTPAGPLQARAFRRLIFV